MLHDSRSADHGERGTGGVSGCAQPEKRLDPVSSGHRSTEKKHLKQRSFVFSAESAVGLSKLREHAPTRNLLVIPSLALIVALVGATGAFQAFPLGTATTYVVYGSLFAALGLSVITLLLGSASTFSSSQLGLAIAATSPLLLSTFWSDSPARTLADSLVMFAFVFIAWAAATRLSAPQAMRIVARTLTGLILLSCLVVAIYPTYGMDGDSRGELWRGIFANKNSFGRVCGLAVLLWSSGISARGGRRRSWAVSALLVTSAGLLASGSKTALAATIVAVLLQLFARRIAVKQSFGFGVAFSIMMVFVLVSVAIPSLGPVLASWFSRDPTLTGRLGLWQSVSEAIAASPYLGRGFAATWQLPGGIGSRISSSIGFEASSAHNGLLDMQLQIGLVGAAFLLLSLTIACARAFRNQGSDRTTKPFLLAVLGFFLTMDLAESALLFGLVWFVVWLYLFASPDKTESGNP